MRVDGICSREEHEDGASGTMASNALYRIIFLLQVSPSKALLHRSFPILKI